MNEQIKKLAYKADDEVNPFRERYLVDLDPAFIQKFAELIILECVTHGVEVMKNLIYAE